MPFFTASTSPLSSFSSKTGPPKRIHLKPAFSTSFAKAGNSLFQANENEGPNDEPYYDDAEYCEGILEEVGEDYLLIKALDKDKGGVVPTGTEYFAHLEWVNTLTHVRDCKKCAVDSAMNSSLKGR